MFDHEDPLRPIDDAVSGQKQQDLMPGDEPRSSMNHQFVVCEACAGKAYIDDGLDIATECLKNPDGGDGVGVVLFSLGPCREDGTTNHAVRLLRELTEVGCCGHIDQACW